MLSNIYLNEEQPISLAARNEVGCYKWIRTWEKQNMVEGILGRTEEAHKISYQIKLREKSYSKEPTPEKGSPFQGLLEIKKWKLEKTKMPYYDDAKRRTRLSYRKQPMKCAQYADDFIIGLFGPKELAIRLKQELTVFLEKELFLTLPQLRWVLSRKNENH